MGSNLVFSSLSNEISNTYICVGMLFCSRLAETKNCGKSPNVDVEIFY